jgi:hypothetical protein
MVPVDCDDGFSSRAKVRGHPSHRAYEPARDACCKYFSAHLETHNSRSLVARKLDQNSVDASNFAVIDIEQFLVEHISN